MSTPTHTGIDLPRKHLMLCTTTPLSPTSRVPPIATSCADREPVALIAIFAYNFPCQNSFSRNVRWREPIRERRWSGHGL
jgi:hypothetical protein